MMLSSGSRQHYAGPSIEHGGGWGGVMGGGVLSMSSQVLTPK